MKIYKYPLEIAAKQQIEFPEEGTEIVALQVQNGVPCLWVKIPEHEYWMGASNTPEKRTFITLGTGQSVNGYNLIHIGTYILGDFVGHVFERVEQ